MSWAEPEQRDLDLRYACAFCEAHFALERLALLHMRSAHPEQSNTEREEIDSERVD